MVVDRGHICQLLFDLHGGIHRSSMSIVDKSPWLWTQVIYVNICLISMKVDTGRLYQLLFDLFGGIHTGHLCQLLFDLY